MWHVMLCTLLQRMDVPVAAGRGCFLSHFAAAQAVAPTVHAAYLHIKWGCTHLPPCAVLRALHSRRSRC